MDIRVFINAEEVAHEAARYIAGLAREGVAARGRFSIAVSGGKTPWLMLKALGKEDVPWENFYVFQVDERIAPSGHVDRNLTHLRVSLLEHSLLKEDHIFEMPVELNNLELAASGYTQVLRLNCGSPPVLDLVHLGLGTDGHTASLVPGDNVLNIVDHDVAITDIYQGRKRMTLTFPMLNRSRNILWVVTGAEKANILKRLQGADGSIPAGRVCQKAALILTDRDAFGDMSSVF